MKRSEESCVDALGMNGNNFKRLCESLRELDLVADTAGLPFRVALVLYMLRKAVTYRTLRDVFQVSLRSISMWAPPFIYA